MRGLVVPESVRILASGGISDLGLGEPCCVGVTSTGTVSERSDHWLRATSRSLHAFLPLKGGSNRTANNVPKSKRRSPRNNKHLKILDLRNGLLGVLG